jgi:transcriptional regulator with XRE-family HTH domain
MHHRLTIPKLAALANVNTKTLSKIERGATTPGKEILDRIAQVLHCPDAAALEARLNAWCEQRIGAAKLAGQLRAIIRLWEQLEADPEAHQMMLTLLRFHVRLLAHRGGAPEGRSIAQAAGTVPRARQSSPPGSFARRTTLASSPQIDADDASETPAAAIGTPKTSRP